MDGQLSELQRDFVFPFFENLVEKVNLTLS